MRFGIIYINNETSISTLTVLMLVFFKEYRMRIGTFWTVLFVFSISIYGNTLKKIGKINNFKIHSDALVVSNDNILINPHFYYETTKSKSRTLVSSSLDIYDIKDIKKPRKLSSIPLNLYSFNMDLSRDKKYLFVLQDNLKIYNIENKKSPKLVASYYIESNGRVSFSVSKNGDYLYITKPLSKSKIKSSEDNFAFHVYDIKDLNHIHLLSKKNIDGISKIWISPSEEKLFYTISRCDSKVIPDKQIGLADISDMENIKVLDESWRYFVGRGSHASVNSALFSKDGKHLYIASGTYGVLVYDISGNSLNNIQRTAGRKVLKFLNCTGSVYDIEHNASFDQFFLVGIDEKMKNLEKISCIRGVKESYFIEGSSSFSIIGRKLLLINNYGYGDGKTYTYVNIYQW